MGKKLFLFCLIGLFCWTMAWAGGNKENESRTADEPAGFTDSIDISGKKAGKYNFYLEAKDKAGNSKIAGPDNIFIDPESDLPKATIINPMMNMRVQGNLNIVGIAVDDDGVGQVQLKITRGKDGKGEEVETVRANGSEYWSYFLDTTDPEKWPDGVYTITAWAIDKKGLSGISEDFKAKARKQHQIVWHLDRKKPEVLVTSHEIGALVSGKIKLKGTVNDGNGIESFAYSIDEGEKYIPAKFSADRRSGQNTWEISLNTGIFENKEKVIWFQSKDRQGTLGTAAHLLFVNNKGPEVKIVYPQPDTVVNGIFNIAGYSTHPVGLKSVSWKAGKDGGEFNMLKGNPWWSAAVDLRNVKTNAIEIEIRAEDVSGNVTVAKQKYKVDQAADLPVVTLLAPEAAAVLGEDGELVVKGSVSDDDGVASIFYSIDSAEAVEIATSGAFQFIVPAIPEGTHLFEIWAKDTTGVTGNKVQVKGITVPAKLPKPRIISFTSNGKPPAISEFYTGMTVTPVSKIKTTMEVSVEAKSLSMLSVSFNDMPPVSIKAAAGKDGMFKTSVALPDNFPEGFVKIELKAADKDREAVYNEYIFVAPTVIPFVPAKGQTMDDAPVLPPVVFSKPFEWIRPNMIGSRIKLNSADEELLGFGGEPLRNAQISGEGSENITVQVDEYGRVILKARREGSFGPFTLNMTGRNGRSYTSGQFSILADFNGPSIALKKTPQGKWLVNTIPEVNFSVSSVNKINAVAYSLDMGVTWINFLTAAEINALETPVNLDITRDINMAAAEDGSVNVLIRAVNEAEKSKTVNFTVMKDTKGPQAELIMPIADAEVNGTISVGFSIKEAGKLKSVKYLRSAFYTDTENQSDTAASETPASSDNAKGEREVTVEIDKNVFISSDWKNDYSVMFLEVLMDSIEMPLDERMAFIFEDDAGNTSRVSSWPFKITREKDIPEAHIILPLDNEVITTDFIVSGVMFDDDGIKQIYWKMDDGAEQVIVAENGFSIPVSISSLTDNNHTVTVVAEDIYGVKGQPVTRSFRVSLSEPAASVTYPLFDTILRDVIEFNGIASDKNEIEEIKISLDNGITYNLAHKVAPASKTAEIKVEEVGAPAAADTAPVPETEKANDNEIKWTYKFNTKILEDGPHVVFVRVTDKYGIPATYSSMINIDNTPPEVIINSPGDGSVSTGKVKIMGQTMDPNLKDIVIELRSLEGKEIIEDIKTRKLDPQTVVNEALDFKDQPDGLYNIEIVATDNAGNITRISRNVALARESLRNYIEILYPLDNENVQGTFNLYGYAGGTDKAQTVTLSVNNSDVSVVEVDDSGYFRFPLDSSLIRSGNNIILVHSKFGGNETTRSRDQKLVYKADGPWVTIDSINIGAFAFERPYLSGRSGYEITEEESHLLSSRDAERSKKNEIRDKTPEYTEISFDNGKTFIKAGGSIAKNVDYRYRLETGEMTEGMHYILVRTKMKNGESAVTRMIVKVDKTSPEIRLISPQAGGRYNEEISYSASATDDVELVSLTYHLRKGDKAAYEVPGFLQGLYIEGVIPPFIRQITNDAPVIPFGGGVTFFDVGMGLSFFGDNVKLQAQYGMMTQDLYEALGGVGQVRYGGHVLGFKLLAGIYTLPFGSIFGPDWEWLSASLTLGANFSLFDMALEGYTQSGNRTWMSALLAQIEFPKVTIPKRKFLRTFSMFTEGQLWFVPTDVNAEELGISTVIPHIVLGLRLYVF